MINLDKHSRIDHGGTSVSCHMGWYPGNCKVSVDSIPAAKQESPLDTVHTCMIWIPGPYVRWQGMYTAIGVTCLWRAPDRQLRERMWSSLWLVLKGEDFLSFTKQKAFGWLLWRSHLCWYWQLWEKTIVHNCSWVMQSLSLALCRGDTAERGLRSLRMRGFTGFL